MQTAYYYGQNVDDPSDQSVICIITDDKGRQYVGQYMTNRKPTPQDGLTYAKAMAGKMAGHRMEQARKAA